MYDIPAKPLQHHYALRANRLVSIPRSRMMPLETISITYYQISQSDVDSFSGLQSISQLKHLEKRSMVLIVLDLMPLRGLLEKVADTLETLDLKVGRMKDFQLSALLPALGQCSQPTHIKLYNNDLLLHAHPEGRFTAHVQGE